MHKDLDMSRMRYNVVMRPWRVECAISTTLGVERIKYTIEAESWNKAYLKASDEIPEFASLFGVPVDDVKIESVTGLPIQQKSSE